MREIVPAALAGERVDRAVALITGLPRSLVAELVEAGGVRLAGRAVTSRSRRVQEGEVLEVDVPERVDVVAEPEASVDVPVVYADDDVVVVDKPPGLVVHPGSGNPTGTLVNGLLARFPDMAGVGPDPERPGVVHRLDKGTSGLIVVARSQRAYDSLVGQLKRRDVERRYTALAAGAIESPGGLIDAPIGRAEADPTRMTVSARGRAARTRYEVQARYTLPIDSTLVECRLETGRTHQIRVHLAAIGHPVIGDARYHGNRSGLECPRPFLHAAHLAFEHPGTGERVSWSSALPPDLDEVRGRLA
ncbi:MAG TPA: RluA family pseudouridine synthase [Acidimicrobiales bacterium]|jgi:23S rRNA pseudouridine1911/1915/1917 synthase|nr:RluA family pseudouridine synthase [Acidimicrobiales bacterium]